MPTINSDVERVVASEIWDCLATMKFGPRMGRLSVPNTDIRVHAIHVFEAMELPIHELEIIFPVQMHKTPHRSFSEYERVRDRFLITTHHWKQWFQLAYLAQKTIRIFEVRKGLAGEERQLIFAIEPDLSYDVDLAYLEKIDEMCEEILDQMEVAHAEVLCFDSKSSIEEITIDAD